jgi:hypothetical protein
VGGIEKSQEIDTLKYCVNFGSAWFKLPPFTPFDTEEKFEKKLFPSLENSELKIACFRRNYKNI